MVSKFTTSKTNKGIIVEFYDEETEQFNTGDETKISRMLGEEVDNPKMNFRLVESILEKRINDLHKHLHGMNKRFDTEKKIYDEIIGDAMNEIDTLEKDLYFRVKGNFETLADDINEQKSLNLLNQKQITNLKKEKNESTLELSKMHIKLDNIEKILGINIKEKREKLEKKNN